MVKAQVLLWGERIGAVALNERTGYCTFAYDDKFVGKGLEPSPLLMPVVKGEVYEFQNINRQTYMGLPGMLAEALPDAFGQDLLNA